MNPGKLDRRITIQELTVTRGDSGCVIEGWSELDTVWAEKIEEGSREFRSAGALHAEMTRLFRIRHRSDITTKHRISFGGRLHDILGTVPDDNGRSNYMLLPAKYTEGLS